VRSVAHRTTLIAADVDDLLAICEAIRDNSIQPWIDIEQVRPVLWAQNVIQIAMRLVRTVPLFLGLCGVGRWQQLEIRGSSTGACRSSYR
jgi:hypothetical protein